MEAEKEYERCLKEKKVKDETLPSGSTFGVNPKEFEEWLAMGQGWVENSGAKANLRDLDFCKRVECKPTKVVGVAR